MLYDIQEFIKKFSELLKVAPPESLAVVMVGSAMVGTMGKTAWDRLRRPPLGPGVSPLPKGDCSNPQHADLEKQLKELRQELDHHAKIDEVLQGEEDELWRFRSDPPPAELLEKLARLGVKIITIANNKGGVGKTTLTANLLACLDQRGYRVLAIDFDYQGSLTQVLLRACGKRLTTVLADQLLAGKSDALKLAIDLQHGALHRLRLTRSKLIPSAYTLARAENRLMLRWLSRHEKQDIRYNLLRVLLSADLADRAKGYDCILIDAPPRLTTATINAFCASTHVIVPTILDGLSSETVPSFLRQTKTLIKASLNPHLELAGIVGTMTAEAGLTADEGEELLSLGRNAQTEWGVNGTVFESWIPDRAAFRKAAGKQLAFFEDRGKNSAEEYINLLADQVIARTGMRQQ